MWLSFMRFHLAIPPSFLHPTNHLHIAGLIFSVLKGSQCPERQVRVFLARVAQVEAAVEVGAGDEALPPGKHALRHLEASSIHLRDLAP